MLTGEPLFTLSGNDEQARKQILNARFLKKKLNDKRNRISPEAFDLLSRMLERDPTKRISAKEALSHTFIMRSYELHPYTARQAGDTISRSTPELINATPLGMVEIMQRMQRFSDMPMLKRAAYIVLAHLIGTDTEDCAAHRWTFRTLDRDGNGSLTYEEFLEGVRLEAIAAGHSPHENVIPADFEGTVWPRVDLNMSDDINFTEFLASTMDAPKDPEKVRRRMILISFVLKICC